MSRNYPSIRISKDGEKFLRNGQMWMYKNNAMNDYDDLENGCIVDVLSEDGEYLGTGFLNKTSHITVRLITKNPDEIIDRDFWKQRIEFAYKYRKAVEPDNLSNCRLVFGEADELPGLTVDRYNDILVTQISAYGLELIKDMIYELLLDTLRQDGQDIKGIYERNDIAVRTKEGLSEYKGPYGNAQVPTKTIINENGLLLNVDVENGQKTGYFLDQKDNRVLVRKLAKGKRVLDCFTHTGGFALNAALGGAKAVTAVDVSQTALDQALANAKLNHLENTMTFTQDDVFKYLETCKKGSFDVIILDPPAFTKSRRTIDHAYNGYKEINLKAMKLLGRGGYLVTASCSRFMEIDNFEKMLREAAREAGVTLRQISVTQQNKDHPILWTMEETSYLKFYIFELM